MKRFVPAFGLAALTVFAACPRGGSVATPASAPPDAAVQIAMPAPPAPPDTGPLHAIDASTADALNTAVDGGDTRPDGTPRSGGQPPIGPADVFGGLRGDEIGNSFGYGGLGLIGTGRGSSPPNGEVPIGLGNIGTLGRRGVAPTEGGGSGMGMIGIGRHDTPNGMIQIGRPVVSGLLPPEVVQRILRHNIASFRYCFERELVRNPTLAGRVSVRIVIGPTGSVLASNLAENTLGSPNVGECIALRIRSLMFPATTGGIAVATAPFTFPPR